MAGTSPLNASAQGCSLAPPCCHLKQEGIKKINKNKSALLCTPVFLCIWPPLGQVSTQALTRPNVSLPHCQTQLHQFKFPAQSPSSLPQVAAGWDRSSCSTRGEKGASPLLKVGLILFLQGTLSSPNPALYQKFFQGIKGPSD